ncbi:receptor activity-modifying protein 1 isoform X2 [Lagenorhynchus albirostris]|uniref:receptor activity-modifying protein 1 isoform X2 n=1 Tax=Lagenorhynchus albirostris TaxID=27610 RepID=UPI0028F0E7F5|nr:receptor activity-modifying protein 1 isoform X2 [Lagenorhynchus albirostris]
MARGLRGLPRRGLWLLLVSHLFMATACQDSTFSTLLHELCLAQFQVDMEAVGRPLWCDWGKTIGVQGPGASEGSSGRGKAKRNNLQMPRSQVGGRPTRRAGSAECCGFPAWAPMSSVQRPAPRFTAQRRTHRSWARGCWLPAPAINMEPARPSRV